MTRPGLPSFREEGVATFPLEGAALPPPETAALDGWVLDARDGDWALRHLSEWRRSPSLDVYAKPVCLFSPAATPDPYLSALADGTVEEGRAITASGERTAEILARAGLLQEEERESVLPDAILRFLRFLYTRQAPSRPVLRRESRFGYVHPFLYAQFPTPDDLRLFDAITVLEKEQLIAGTFFERLRQCNRCRSVFLNFRESCPKCRSANLTPHETIHHFVCGYVGPESDFAQDDNLLCPKCGKLLRHIGVDYDRPSSVFTCNACGTSFQDPVVDARCFHCGHLAAAENLVIHDEKVFEITPAGENFAVHGIRFSISDLFRSMLDIMEFPVFRKILHYEVERMKRYNRESCLAGLQFRNITDLYLKLGERKDQFVMEMARIITESLRKSDVIAALNASTFLFLMVETGLANARLVADRLQARLQKLGLDNLVFPEGEFRLDIQIRTVPVNGDRSAEALLDELALS